MAKVCAEMSEALWVGCGYCLKPIRRFIVQKYVKTTAAALLALSLGACANMNAQQKNTAIGAAVGGVAGSILTGGSAVGTVGGAAVGGVIGNQVKR